MNWTEFPERMRQNGMPFSNALQEYYTQIFRKRHQDREERLKAIHTREDALAYIHDVRARIQAHFPMPQNKTPLNAHVRYHREENGFFAEGIIFSSRPGLSVTSLLLGPLTPGPHPAILFLCGHSRTGKIGHYQTVAADMARQGFIVLMPDPIGQGERRETDLPPPCEHNCLGRRLGLAGESFAAWRTYDAIRSLDYLLSRPEVDSTFLGVTGCSGGCTLTSYLMALDERPTISAPVCAITSWLRNVENELPCDMEQLPQGLGTECLEMADLLIAAAPRPILIGGEKNDFFDVRGAEEAIENLRKIYGLLGCPERVQFHQDEGWHGYNDGQRLAVQHFFGKYARLEQNIPPCPDHQELPGAQLWCMPQGKLKGTAEYIPHGRLAAECCRKAAADRLARPPREDDALKAALADFLAIGECRAPAYRSLRMSHSEKFPYIGRFGLETEPGCVMAVLKVPATDDNPCYRPPEGKRVLLYIAHLDAQAELLRKTPEFDGIVCGLDVRGIGELTPGGCEQLPRRDFFHLYEGDYHYASLGDFLGEPILGKRVRDILCAIRFLQARHCTVELHGFCQGSIPALFAAFLADCPVTLEGMPESYLRLAETENDTVPLALLPFGMLNVCDINELEQRLQQKGLLHAVPQNC